jgi:hypothetical protein
MIEILDSPKHLVAMRLSGNITAADVAAAYNATEDALTKNDRISFYAEIEDASSLTIEGVAKDIFEGLGQICKLSRYYRAAVVTDKGWIANIARAEGVLFCMMDIRVFGTKEANKALAWASEEPKAPEQPASSIHLIQTTKKTVFAYEVNGPIRERDVKTAVRGLNDAFKGHKKINVLARMKNWAGFELASIFSDELFRMKYSALSKVDKYAVVGPRPWMRNFLELINPLISTKIRVFDISEESVAWEWVGAQQALLSE